MTDNRSCRNLWIVDVCYGEKLRARQWKPTYTTTGSKDLLSGYQRSSKLDLGLRRQRWPQDSRIIAEKDLFSDRIVHNAAAENRIDANLLANRPKIGRENRPDLNLKAISTNCWRHSDLIRINSVSNRQRKKKDTLSQVLTTKQRSLIHILRWNQHHFELNFDR